MNNYLIREIKGLKIIFNTHDDLLRHDVFFSKMEEYLNFKEKSLPKSSYTICRTTPYNFLVVYNLDGKLTLLHLHNKTPKRISKSITAVELNIDNFDFDKFKDRCEKITKDKVIQELIENIGW